MAADVIHGDCREVLRQFPDDHFDSCVTDPPYELTGGKKGGSGEASLNLDSPAGRSRISTGGGFMGKEWDSTGVAFDPATWREVFRVLRPGAHLAAFGGTRTYHRMAVAIEDAGFEIRDSLHWVYGSGFPKSLDVSKAIDKAAGAEREGTGVFSDNGGLKSGHSVLIGGGLPSQHREITAPATDAAQQWDGWGTALKPAHEPIILARKPLAEKTVAANVLAHGTGALNIDGCRVKHASEADRIESETKNQHADFGSAARQNHVFGDMSQEPPGNYDGSAGRFPPNILLTHNADCNGICAPGCPVAGLDGQSGISTATGGSGSGSTALGQGSGWNTHNNRRTEISRMGDTGGASRFFPQFTWDLLYDLPFMYCAKAPKKERPSVERMTSHPTVKPLSLMKWLVRLITPPEGVVLDPFAGTGTTGQAARDEDFGYVLIEREPDYIKLISKRLYREPSLFDEFPEACV